MDRSRLGYGHLVTRVTLPAAGLVALSLFCLLGVLWLVADYQTAVAQGEQARLAEGAVTVRGEHIEKSALDYGAWDEAVEKLVVAPDLEWADRNIGQPTFENLGFDMSFVVTPENLTRYAMVRGNRTARPIGELLTSGYDVLLARQRSEGSGGSTSGFILAEGEPALAAIVPIRPLRDDPAGATPRHLLVLVDVIDTPMLEEFAHIYLLPGLRRANAATASNASVPLITAAGERVVTLEWDGARPGDGLLKIAGPAWMAVAAAFGVLTILFVRQTRSAARSIAESEHRATHDALTGLPNRVLLFEHLDRLSRSLAEGGTGFAVGYLDLDGFKAVNDTLGHEAGDAVLEEVARRLKTSLGAEDFAARLGGDEFAVILPQCEHPHQALAIGRKIVAAIEQPLSVQGADAIGVSATIGVTFAPKDGADPLVLLRNADQALYIGKRQGKGQVRFHAEAIDHRLTA